MSETPNNLFQTEMNELKNIGKRSAQWLYSVGIHTLADLEKAGVVNAYLRAKAAYPDQVTLNLLYALQGALLNLHWNDLPNGMKDDLRDAVHGVKTVHGRD